MDNHKPRVLIVDDEKGLRIGTKRLLEQEGYSVTTAENGTEGIQFGTSEEFDIAIIDLKMPDIDGITVLKEIRSKYPNTVCFIATAYASYDTAIESTKLGAFSYIPKPFTPEEFLNNISKGYETRLHILEKENWIREREARLLEVAFEKSRINTIINSISDGILVVNRNAETVLFNPSALVYLSLEKINIEENILDRIHPKISELIKKCLHDGRYVKKSYSSQVELKPGHELVIDATSSPVPHPDGSLAGVVVVLKNITELKKIEYIKSQFVSMVSHELKAPIAAVYGFLKILSDPNISVSSEQQQSFIVRSQTRLESLLKMVNDLLDISRMEMNTYQKEIIEIDINDIISNILELFRFEIENKKIEVTKNIIQPLPLIHGDNGEITRLFTNLLSNAVKYNREKGKIKILISSSESYLMVEISDTGIGMKEDEVSRLFHEFYRAKNEYTKNISGTGLGLSIVKRIVDANSGKIEVFSEYKTGTTFKIFLPLNKGNAQKADSKLTV
jgi:PAS domain S-box-containing protein